MPLLQRQTLLTSWQKSRINCNQNYRKLKRTGKKKKNLPMAKQTIDILAMLEEKTKGNLADDESQLLKNILYDLRMRYVKETA